MLQTRSAKRTAAAAVKIAADLVDEGIIDRREALARIEPAQVDQLLRDQFDPEAKTRARRIATGLNASPGAAVGAAVFDADRAAERAVTGEQRHPGARRDLTRRLPRHGRRPGRAHGTRRGHVPRGRGRAPDRQALRGRLLGAGRRLQQPHRLRRGGHLRRGRPDQPRRLDRRGLPGRAAHGRGPLRGADRAAGDPGLGRRGAPPAGLDERRQARGGRPGPPLRGAGHRPLPHRAHVPRGRAPGDRARRDPGRLPGHAGQGTCRHGRAPERRGAGRRGPLRRRDGQAGGAPGGRLPRHLRGHERAARGHPPHRSAAPRVPAQPRGADRDGLALRGAGDARDRPRLRRGARRPARRGGAARAEPHARAARRAAWG